MSQDSFSLLWKWAEAFIGKYCSLIWQLQNGACGDSSKQQQSLVQVQFQGIHPNTVLVYDFARGYQVPGLSGLAQVVEYCKAAVVWKLGPLQGLFG